MSNKFNQNNNTNGYKTHIDGDRHHKVIPSEFKVSLCLPENIDENINNEILDVLANTKFASISIPLNTYKYLIDPANSIDKKRVSTVGYIRNYDKETNVFTIVIFNRFVNIIKSWNNEIVIDLTYVDDRNGHLKTITKFNVLPSTVTEKD